ncbi:MAG: DUF3597 family protein [Candidatus Brevundimonas colombiensis]|jgi:3-oxoacyl-ACP reductase-like protein|uniref:DUF3597 family protein n=1 Tax=Candidatus Brevundimonas colombiensis TaxID=3121376 RepID=A0AAJ6BLP2_9CAUL|nr:DUF3597 family protein [Brevundimonas sp.]WEK40567.1 MAG: DUF3597 family protein [Brevundimonas sp.]
MGIFSSIWNKITNHKPAAAPAPAPTAAPAGAAPTAAPAALPPVDVEAVLSGLAANKGGGGNWRTSIVDLLKLLDLDSSLSARKELAEELNVHAGEHGSAEQNIALSKAVWRKLAENGGQVPASLRD